MPTALRDRTLVFDLDEGGFHEGSPWPAPPPRPRARRCTSRGCPYAAGIPAREAARRLERFADQVLPGWRNRATFHRTSTAGNRTGADDPPGSTWRDRPSIDRGEGLRLAGDMVAAPGTRGGIPINSALRAVRSAVTGLRPRTAP
ncbi:hypothetical protein [Streptomyces fumanus]|uniref:hypothetical protein n=1 Tax=Streptomyces fumanus TaxID=67302 RepID=UPI00340349C5